MSDDLNEFLSDGTSQGGQETGGQLRGKLEQALALLKAANDERDALKAEKEQLTLDNTWQDLKVPDVIRGFYKGDKTADAIKKWWEESKGFFNIPDGEGAPLDQRETTEQRAVREAHQGFQQAASVGTDLNGAGIEAAIAKGRDAKNLTGDAFQAARAEFYKAFNTRPV